MREAIKAPTIVATTVTPWAALSVGDAVVAEATSSFSPLQKVPSELTSIVPGQLMAPLPLSLPIVTSARTVR